MDGSIVAKDVSALVDDRVDEGMFRVDRSVYTDEALFEKEIDRIFEKCWVFLCHESQVAAHGDYFWTEIGRQPVYVHRQEDGSLNPDAVPPRQCENTDLPFSRLELQVRWRLHGDQERRTQHG